MHYIHLFIRTLATVLACVGGLCLLACLGIGTGQASLAYASNVPVSIHNTSNGIHEDARCCPHSSGSHSSVSHGGSGSEEGGTSEENGTTHSTGSSSFPYSSYHRTYPSNAFSDPSSIWIVLVVVAIVVAWNIYRRRRSR